MKTTKSMKRTTNRKRTPPWTPPTRRAFVGMLGAAAAALALRVRPTVVTEPTEIAEPDPPRSPWIGTTRWIGHC